MLLLGLLGLSSLTFGIDWMRPKEATLYGHVNWAGSHLEYRHLFGSPLALWLRIAHWDHPSQYTDTIVEDTITYLMDYTQDIVSYEVGVGWRFPLGRRIYATLGAGATGDFYTSTRHWGGAEAVYHNSSPGLVLSAGVRFHHLLERYDWRGRIRVGVVWGAELRYRRLALSREETWEGPKNCAEITTTLGVLW